MGLWKKVLEQSSDHRRTRISNGPFDVSIEEMGKTQRWERTQWAPEAAEEFNQKLMVWGAKVNAAMPGSIAAHGIGGSRLARSIRNTYYYEFGEIYRLGFSFAREGIFIHKGVGRGYVMSGDIVVKLSKSLGFNRRPKPWFNPVVQSYMAELEDIILSYTHTAVINSTRIYIR